MNLGTAPAPWNDGHVHALKAQTAEGGVRTVTTRCGLELPQATYVDGTHVPLWGATGWETMVTCPDCKGPT